MKSFIAFLFLIFLAGDVFACRNLIPVSEAQKAIAKDAGAGKKSCKDLPAEQCLCFDGIVWEAAELVDVMENDLTKPNYEAKSNVVTCAAVADDPLTTEIDEAKTQEQDCLEKEAAHTCPELGGYMVVRVQDNSEVYCTRIVSYEQKPSGIQTLRNDSTKVADFEAAQGAKVAKEMAISMAMRSISCGKRVIAMLVVQNASKGLSTGQIKSMNKTYRDIKELLETGSLDSAREEILAANVDGVLVTETDKTVLVAELDSCKP